MKNKFISKFLTTGCLLLSTSPLYHLAAATEQAANPHRLSNLLEYLLLGIGSFIVFATIAFLYRFAFMLMEEQKRQLYKEQGIEIAKPVKKASLWERLYEKSVGLVPIEAERDIMLDHNYDGIRELDNKLPPWWVAMFYITIVIGTAYFLYYHYFDYGLSSRAEYALEMDYAQKAQARILEKQANAINESNVIALKDAESLAVGESIYKASCAACHGQLGEGLVGPNMTDNYWIHGGDIKSVFKTIKYGVPEKGMIAWKTQMNPASIHQVASYIMTLVGTNPPNPKAAQGVLVTPE